MRSTTTRTAALALTMSVVAACSSDSASTATTQAATTVPAPPEAATTVPVASTTVVAPESTPFHAVSDDAVVVSGTAACEFSDEGVGTDGEPGAFLVVCELDLSDPRVSGTERHDRFDFVAEGRGGTVWLVGDATITNADGTWRGSAQAAEDAAAIPTGEAHYVGEGAYEGLEFHSYFFHPDLDAPAEVRGWISDGA